MAKIGHIFENIKKSTSDSDSAPKNYYLVVFASLEIEFEKFQKNQPFLAKNEISRSIFSK